ncbi:adhesion G-protein coupled receptor G4-like [Xenopus laevis]|uniref:Adhesion G-protein coupled receptor G4-like n=1 Tax=Xenopus laevis TaxID=8355 RepID=A0A8J1LK06_XENLA|nr:adhesion G-protein coupled receptor G4-like [Xenopus laevis]
MPLSTSANNMPTSTSGSNTSIITSGISSSVSTSTTSTLTSNSSTNMPHSTSTNNMPTSTSGSNTSIITSGISSSVSTSTTSTLTSNRSTNMPHSTNTSNMPTSTSGSNTSIITSGISSSVSTSTTSTLTSNSSTNMPHSTNTNNMSTSTSSSYTSIITSSTSSSVSTSIISTTTSSSSTNMPSSTSANNIPISTTSIPITISTTSMPIVTSATSMSIRTSATSTTISTDMTKVTSATNITSSATNTIKNTPTTAVISQAAQSLLTSPAGLTTTKSSEKITTSIASKPTTTVSFYLVLMNISVSGGSINEDLALELTKNMMNLILKDTDFAVVQLKVNLRYSNDPLDEPEQSAKIKRSEIRDSADFIFESKLALLATSSETHDTLTKSLTNLLKNFNYTDTQLQMNLSVMSVRVQHLVLGRCPQETMISGNKGTYEWMAEDPTETAMHPCQKNPEEFATRYCNINITTERPNWENPDVERCLPIQAFPETIKELQNIVVTLENANTLAKHILNLIKDFETLSRDETNIILTKISEIVGLGGFNLMRAQTLLAILNNIMIKGAELWTFTNRILNLTEKIGYIMDFSGMTASVIEATMAFSVSNVQFYTFEEIYFTVKSYEQGKNPEITLQKVPVDQAVAYVYLPQEIKNHVDAAISKVQFNFFGKTSLFKDYSCSSTLNTYVISASIEGTRIQGLNEPVLLTLRHIIENKNEKPVQCVFWDFNANNRMGGWNSSGCSVQYGNANYTTCYCTHLTHFGVLLDLSREDVDPSNDRIMSLLTYAGCGISSLFLGVSLVTYLAFKSLRKDYPSKILMNLSVALIMLNLVFLMNNWLSSFQDYGLCITCAALLHYFLLASFTWMGLEAVHMYFAFVKVFNLYIRNYILKFCLVGWGIPAIVVAIVLSIKRDYYGSGSHHIHYAVTEETELFCWIQNNVVFYVTVVGYFCFIFLTNIAMFIVVFIQINTLKSKRMKDWKSSFIRDLKSTISLAFLLGLTWGFAFLAWGPVKIAFLYLFSIFNTLQGKLVSCLG